MVLADQPIWSLGSLTVHSWLLRQTQLLRNTEKDQTKSYLPVSKIKVWCYQFTLHQSVIWPLKLCEITAITALNLDSKSNSYICKRLGLPPVPHQFCLVWWGSDPKMWYKATKWEVRNKRYKIRVTWEKQQGNWKTCEAVINRDSSWANKWKIPQGKAELPHGVCTFAKDLGEFCQKQKGSKQSALIFTRCPCWLLLISVHFHRQRRE